jgi:hypothetical protein
MIDENEIPALPPLPVTATPTPSAAAPTVASSGPAPRLSLIDNPIQGISQDSLALSRYAYALAEFIDGCDTPVTIGIQGDWGIGKTSLLRMLEELLLPRRGRRFQTPTIYMNTWQYAQFKQEEFLAISILNGIVKEIELRFGDRAKEEVKQMQRVGMRLARFVGAVTSSAIESQTGVNIAAGVAAAKDEDPMAAMSGPDMAAVLQNYRDRFAKLVAKVLQGPRDKLVIMIDDLDRVRPGKALEMLEAIKNFVDVPGCVFILAVDYGVIQQGVADRLGPEAQLTHGKSYFDKIIQVPFNMPVSAYQLDNYIASLLGWKFDGDRAQLMEEAFLPAPSKDAAEHRAYFENLTRMSVGSNPRGIKRVVNYVKLLRLVRDEGARAATAGIGRGASDRRWDMQSAKILYALACMQLEWPEVFSYFVRNPSPALLMRFESWEAISQMNELRGMWKRYPDQDQARTNLIGFFDELIAIVDEDGNGEIAVEEFRPIWTVLRDAQLTNVDLPDAQQVWGPMEELLGKAVANAPNCKKVLEALRMSSWNNPVSLRIKRAGRRFVNMIWDDDSFASLVTAKRFPLEMYVNVRDPNAFLTANPDLAAVIDLAERGHFGVGNLEVSIDRLGSQPIEKQQEFLSALHAKLIADYTRR